MDDEDEIKKSRREDLIELKEKSNDIIKVEKDENKKNYTFFYIDIFTYDIKITNIEIKFFDIRDGAYQSLYNEYNNRIVSK